MYLDGITYDEIEPKRRVALRSGETINYCDIATLAHWISTGSLTNPFTRQPLPDEICELVRRYQEKRLITVCINFRCSVQLPKKMRLGTFIINTFALTGSIARIRELDVCYEGRSLYTCNLSTRIDKVGVGDVVFTRPTSPEKLRRMLEWLADCNDCRRDVVRRMIESELRYGRH